MHAILWELATIVTFGLILGICYGRRIPTHPLPDKVSWPVPIRRGGLPSTRKLALELAATPLHAPVAQLQGGCHLRSLHLHLCAFHSQIGWPLQLSRIATKQSVNQRTLGTLRMLLVNALSRRWNLSCGIKSSTCEVPDLSHLQRLWAMWSTQ